MVNGARGVAADKYGNVYIAETGNTNIGLRYRLVLGPQTSAYFAGNNPLYAFLGNYAGYTGKVHVGYIYTIAGGFTAPASGAACGTFTSTDAYGDGCPFFYSNMNGSVQGVAVDNSGNAIFSDTVHSLLRVLYAGGANAAVNPMYAAVVANNPGVTPAAGNIYLLAGGATTGNTFSSTTATLGSAVILSNGIQRLNIGPGGNIYLGDTGQTQVLLYDISTGYVRQLFKNAPAVCAAHVAGSTNGDGCAGPLGFTFSSANALGIAPDPLGNVYLADQANGLLRKVEAVSLIPTVVGSQTAAAAALTQTLEFHGPVGTTNIAVATLNDAPDVAVGAASCAGAYADATMDCTVPVTFAPSQPGVRTANVSVTALNAGGTALGSKVFPVSGMGLGSALVTDTATPAVASSNGLTPVTAALDSSGNFYTVDTGSGQVIKANVVSGTNAALGAAPANPLETSVDTAGDVFITSSASASYTEFVQNTDGSYTSNTLTNPAVALPQGIAVDATGNQYIVDKTAPGTLFEVPVGSAFANAQPASVLATGFTNPVGVAIDGLGNIFVADQGLPGVYKISNVNGVQTKTVYAAGSGATITVALTPTAIAADAAGNLYVQDATTNSVIAIPANQTGPVSTIVLSGQTTPSGVAVDGNGVVYATDAGAPALRQVQRNALTFDFGTSTSVTFAGTITNVGNVAATGYQLSGLDTNDFPITSVSPAACFSTTASSLPGFACSVTAAFTPTSGTGPVSSTVAYTAAASTTGALQFTGTKSGAAVTTTTAIGTAAPAAPVYSVAGTEVTFPVTVMASDSSTPAGSVTVSIDGGATTSYALTNGAATVPVSGLAAGSHTIVAAYASQGGLTGSTSMTLPFTIAQAAVTVSWTPATTTQQFSAAVGTGVLNATATSGGTPVAGAFIYTATPSGGAAAPIHSASFLAIGSYGLGVTFVPADATDFSGGSASVPAYAVTRATTTAGLGATQNLVAADGTGNYTSVQAAINTIGATAGGSVYIKPGTYTGDVTVVQPNVSLRGLGGDPAAVVMTHAGGAFGGAGVYMYAGEFNTSQANGAQLPPGSTLFNGDEGSATLVVAKGVNTAASTATLIPNGFYGENFTLANTYDSDTTTTTTTYLPGSNSGTCTANQGPAQTYNYLFENGLLCASQALAIWTTADLSVMNNIYSTSLQDTIYAGSQGSGSNGYVPARQYWFRGKVTGTVDYIFGDAAAAFDYSSIYTLPHGANGQITGTATIEAQNKMVQTGSANDYLSGYVMNSNVFTSLVTGQTGLQFGRPYGPFSTWILLNSYVDQVAPGGYIEFSNSTTNLPTSTYDEYNDIPYTDPAPGAADLNGVLYLGTGGSSGAGVTGPRETVSQSPGTPMSANAVKTSMTQAQAQRYFPNNFLGTTVPANVSSTANWNPTAALATSVNAFATGGTATSIAGGSSVTILMRPQTPGLGAVTNGVYTVPTGTYTLTDTYNGATTTLASGSLDAAGEAYYTTAALNAGSHSLAWTYGGDANFAGSTATAYTLAVSGTASTTTVQTMSPITYGQAANVVATVASASGTPAGSVVLTIDGATTQTQALEGGQTTFTVTGLAAGVHTFTAAYGGSTTFGNSATLAATSLTVNKAVLTVTATCANRVYGAADSCSAAVQGYQYSDSVGTVFSTAPTGTTTATPTSPSGNYTATPANTALTPFGDANYTVTPVNTTFTVSGGAPQAILFYPLPSFTQGAYQLTARTTSGLPVTYTITAGGGIASVSGSTLTVIGTGTVTVQASQATDATGDYAAAAPVSRSFTAQ